jgi:integrase
VGAYAPERTLYFLQYHGEPDDLLWCGDLIAHNLLWKTSRPPSWQPEKHSGSLDSKYEEFRITRPGLLSPVKADGLWLRRIKHPDEILFEPESLWRGILYAAALATVALTNGCRLSELLQMSAIRFETIAVDELKNQQPTGRKIGILVQNLLPKGYTKESERQFFLVGELAGRLLAEIGQLLEATHGGSIPIVHPYNSTKEEDLFPEPYLFQWDVKDGGRIGLLVGTDVAHLLRFLFHGLDLATRTGKPIRVVPHLLRHLLATHARTVKNVPAEAVAYLLHHRVLLSDSRHALSISEATAYYSRMTVEQVLALLFEAQSTLTSQMTRTYLQAPSPRTLEQMDAELRQIFEQWSVIGPTVLGYCGAGLCIRPDNRALCLGCRFLVPHYSNLPQAKTWRKLYVLQAEQHDANGHHIDAKQARQMIQYLDDIITIMEIQIRTRQDGGYLPFADMLPPAEGEKGDEQ